ncbi:thiol reductant ABC exporter subunit CydC [Kribbia dieselivorans]|uniref:thiol reductant ABC exporter subunit CydC n=1 Tax=Kribbia dieselivorans TaxID=331526 RepID=UPI0009FB0D86|nr:thiol reductant ABC exporter subunit CydC [Kribbia dieselivorans]
MTTDRTTTTTTRTNPLTLTRSTILGGLLGGIATAAGIALTATSGWLIVRASERPQILLLLTAIVGVRTFGLARPVFRYWERLVSHDGSLRDLAERRAATYAALVPLTPARLGRRRRSDVLNGIVDDLTDVVEASVRVTVPVFSAAVAGIIAAIVTVLFNPGVGAVLAAMLVACALLFVLSWRLECAAQDDLLAARAEVTRVSTLVADHAGDLQAIGGQADALSWVWQADARVRTATSRQSRGRALTAALLLVITGVATIAAAYLAQRSGSHIAIVAMLTLIPVATGEALGVLTEATRALARAQGSARRLDAMLDQTPAVADPAATPGLIAAHPDGHDLALADVTASWDGTGDHLPPTSLDLSAGDRIAVVGPNGSGKSTLLAVLVRHLDPTAGRYALGGADTARIPLAQARAAFALVDDEPHIFATSVRNNLRLADATQAGDTAIRDALTAAGLAMWLDGLDEGLDTRLGAGGRGVSGGERARLAVARAVLSDRPVVALDEPTAHLDTTTARAVLADVLTATAGRTVVMVTHHHADREGFDRTLELSSTESGRAE